MKTAYTRYSISITSEEQKDILVALLADWGIEGFEEDNELLHASGKLDPSTQEIIENYLSENVLTYSKSIVEDKNWNAIWESNFEPVRVDDFVGIRADFHAPLPNVEHEIVITPKMSFGTGHHATTFLMMKLMHHLPFTDARVFDFGTGTGILAILAEKLGAKEVLAVDYDDWCIENAGENFERNSCTHVVLQKTAEAPAGRNFDIILANINKNVILSNIVKIGKGINEGGDLLLSGLLVNDEADIVAAAGSCGFTLEKKMDKNGWIALYFKKQLRN